MKFVIIDAKARETRTVDCKTLKDAQQLAGLQSVDHGSLAPGVGYVTDEYGLFLKPVENHPHYFATCNRLVCGNAVLYGYDETGDTIDIERVPMVVVFLNGLEEIERAFANKLCERPQILINGNVVWEWPTPQPNLDDLFHDIMKG